MIKMTLLEPSKETEAKLRWSKFINKDRAPFHLYIPKHRVPEPWPSNIFVNIEPCPAGCYLPIKTWREVEHSEREIRVIIEKVCKHTRTIRFAPRGDKHNWEIGEPYIPFSLIPPGSEKLILEVAWDLASKGRFVNVPTYRNEI